MNRNTVTVQLAPLTSLDKGEVLLYWREFEEAGERENVLWELDRYDIDEYYRRQEEDERNRRFAFLVNGELVGVARISSRVNFEANGKIGYSIRPSRRRMLYAPTLLRLIEEYCRMNGIAPVTACVDVRNTASLKAFRMAGFVETGWIFDWQPNPLPRKAIELILPDYSASRGH